MIFNLFLAGLIVFAGVEADIMRSDKVNLPDTVDGWDLKGTPRRIDESSIFDYMDGAGELYLSYNFQYLMVYRYAGSGDNQIRVEIYRMKDSRDAFGLLSQDWGGKPVELDQRDGGVKEGSIVPPHRALYGRGLLRAWSDDLYIRIMAFRDTPEARQTVIKLGKIITSGRNSPPRPELLEIIRPSTVSGWILKRDRTAYFYSHLVLNSHFYLSHENILNLDHSTEALITTFKSSRKEEEGVTARLLAIKYPDSGKAAAALTDFISAYLPERSEEAERGRGEQNNDFFYVEDGWMGYRKRGRFLALVFGCPGREAAGRVLDQAILDDLSEED